ncbi:MAG: 50S ribosomal protein L22 [Candidatus Altiarchaeales archaeon IMC4]|nr:ribosomal protein L22 [uncultured archaeon]ODS42820.1 MAG: 50S ribosomal protein L22 [Candidatus Altiarchaeales archaeon IMC4]
MKLNYSKAADETQAQAIGKDMDMSFRHAVEVCGAIRGMKLQDAIGLLDDVVEGKRMIPFKRHIRGIGHKKGQFNLARYPKKASGNIRGVLKNAEANAGFKGLDTDSLKVTHVQALKGFARARRKPKGRWKSWKSRRVHIQVVVSGT